MSNQWIWIGAAVSLLMLAGCAPKERSELRTRYARGEYTMTIDQQPFGSTPDGREVMLFTLTNTTGVQVEISNYGGIVTRLYVPDRDGRLGDVVLGYNNLDDYIKSSPYFGCIVGRYGNRIAGGRFTLDGREYTLATNNGPNHLHGGDKGFDKVVWAAEAVEHDDAVGVIFTYMSPDGEEGYPGNLACRVTYLLTNRDELRIEYRATTDKPTVVNLTHHGYWNLTGGERDILGHELMLNADRFTPVDEGLIPTGELRPVEGTPLDFRKPTPIGERINAETEQMRFGGGYDHNFVLNASEGRGLNLAARVHEPTTGRVMEVLTTEPGVQFYSGNFLDGTLTGKYGVVYKKRWGFCLETQHYPDSPNKPVFPSTVLRPGDAYATTTVYRFTTDRE